ncbi:Uncharacterized protein LB4E_1620 [Leptospira borgpetersenii str. 4E]|nr:Uncharacterized protein LB4E_1620 [Leptospira borgpetersenii str. 4E]
MRARRVLMCFDKIRSLAKMFEADLTRFLNKNRETEEVTF